MRDRFYHWLILSTWMAVYFGASMARAVGGDVHLVDIIASGTVALAASWCTASHYREAVDRQRQQQTNETRKD